MLRIYSLCLILFLFTGCFTGDRIDEEEIGQPVSDYTKEFIENLEAGEVESCLHQMVLEYQTEDSWKLLSELSELVKGKERKDHSLLHYRSRTTYLDDPITVYELSYEYEYQDLWVYYNFQIREKKERFTVLGLNISPENESLRGIYDFDFQDKDWVQFLFFFLMIAVPIFILVSIVFLFKTPMRRKWLWVIFMLLGFFPFKMNWETGDFGLQLLSVQILGASFVKGGVLLPWLVSFSIPVGAILFWFKRTKILKEQEVTDFWQSDQPSEDEAVG